MKKTQKKLLPVSLRDLAAYLNISASTLNMSQTGRHGNRNLGSDASKKYGELILAHRQTPKMAIINTALRNDHPGSEKESATLAKKMLTNSKHALAKASLLKYKLDDMKSKEREDSRWLKTVERLLSEMAANKNMSSDRKWLMNQQIITRKRLDRNRWLVQAKLEIKIESAKAMARVYKNIYRKLK
jgi:hypothetical protein